MTCPFIWDDPFFSYPNRGIVEKKHHRCSPPATATPVGGEDVSAGQIQATLRRWAVHRLPMVPMLPHKLKPGESRPMPTSLRFGPLPPPFPSGGPGLEEFFHLEKRKASVGWWFIHSAWIMDI